MRPLWRTGCLVVAIGNPTIKKKEIDFFSKCIAFRVFKNFNQVTRQHFQKKVL